MRSKEHVGTLLGMVVRYLFERQQREREDLPAGRQEIFSLEKNYSVS